MPNSSMQELLIDQLRDLYDAEKQLTKALPKMAKAATDEELAQGFREHLEQTQGQARRIEQIFEAMGQKARSKPCAAMKGLIQEGQEAMQEDFPETLLDLALVAAGRRVEHYEMAAYDTLVMACKAAKQTEVAGLLEETLREEVETDKKLATIGKRLAKEAARQENSEEAESGTKGKTTKASKGSGSSRASAGSGSSRSNGHGRAKRAGSGSSSAASSTGSGEEEGGGGHLSHTTVDHDEIREWAEARGGKPACVMGTGGKGETGMLRIEFPGKPNANDSKLQEIEWDEFFEKFDERGLALVYQDQTAGGQKSNFNKLVSREGTGSKSRGAH